MNEAASQFLIAARFWPGLVFGIAGGALLWLLGLGRLRGAATAGATLLVLFVAAAWPGAGIGFAALALAGASGRIAAQLQESPVDDGRLTLRITLALAGIAALAACVAAIGGESSYLWVAVVAALTGGTSTRIGLVFRQARPGVQGIGYAAAGIAALALAALAHQQRLIGPGDGVLMVVPALIAFAVSARSRLPDFLRVALGSLTTAVVAMALVRLLP